MTNGSDSIETEWQFEADDLERVERWLLEQPASASLAFVATKETLQRDAYLDTDAWDISRARFALRLRRIGDTTEATLKGFGGKSDGPRKRREITQQLPTGLSLTRGSGAVSDRVRLLTGERELQTLFEVETRRRTFRVDDNGQAVAELALDDALVIVEGRQLSRLKRVEVECIGPTAESPLLRSFLQALTDAAGLQPAATSKYEAGLAAAGLQPDMPGNEDAEASAEDSASQFALSLLRHNLSEMLEHEPGTRLGEDPEELHDMRVQLRRLRAALSFFKDAVPPEILDSRDDLRWLGRALGEVRDLDVQIAGFTSQRAKASWEGSIALGELLQILHGSRTEARARLLEALESERYRMLVLRLEASLAAEPDSLPVDTPVGVYVAPLLKKRHRKFEDGAKDLAPDSPPGLYHEERILGKRLRYSVDFTSTIFGRPAERMYEAMSDIQDLLGEHQDAAVTIDWLQDLVRTRGASLSPATLFYMGDLVASNRARMAELRSQWPDAFDGAERRWRRLRREINRMQEPDEDAPAEPEDAEA